jgi:hypothetical protein
LTRKPQWFPSTPRSNELVGDFYQKGRHLLTRELVVELIAHTRTESELTIRAELDGTAHEKGVKISKSTVDALNMRPHEFHGEWDYTVSPESNTMN